ncbi:hypothetical protein MMC30_005894 [Trapelia coarctata]|nr:hypothetical protein [Trapelia coarctata]
MTSPVASSTSLHLDGHSSANVPVEAKSPQIKILLWNLWLLPSLLTDRHSHTRALTISPLLNDYDIVVLNEGFTNKKALLSHTNHPYRYIPPCPRGRLVDSGLIFLSKYEIVGSGCEKYERVAGIDRFAGKGIGFVTVKVEGHGHVQVFGTHMQAGASKSIQIARATQATQAGKFVAREKTADKEAVVILAGDLNMGPRQDATCEEFSVHYVDQEDAKARCAAYDEMVERSGLREVDCEAGWEYSRDVCRFLVSGLEYGKGDAAATYEQLSGPGSRRLSDTKPLCLTLSLREGSQCHKSE